MKREYYKRNGWKIMIYEKIAMNSKELDVREITIFFSETAGLTSIGQVLDYTANEISSFKDTSSVTGEPVL